MNTRTDLGELRRLWAKVKTITWGIVVPDTTQKQEISEALDRTFDAPTPALIAELEAAREEVESMRNDRDGALYFIRLNGHELQHADQLLAARDRRMKAIGAAEEWETEAAIAKAAGRDLITYQREYLEQRAAKLRQEAEDGK